MGRKVFQDFAHVLCQKFVEMPSNIDLVNLVIFGDGRLELEISAGIATHNRYPVRPLPYCDEMRRWLDKRLAVLQIPPAELTRAALFVDYKVKLNRRIPALIDAEFDFVCIGIVVAPDREYTSSLTAQKSWGVGQV